MPKNKSGKKRRQSFSVGRGRGKKRGVFEGSIWDFLRAVEHISVNKVRLGQECPKPKEGMR